MTGTYRGLRISGKLQLLLGAARKPLTANEVKSRPPHFSVIGHGGHGPVCPCPRHLNKKKDMVDTVKVHVLPVSMSTGTDRLDIGTRDTLPLGRCVHRVHVQCTATVSLSSSSKGKGKAVVDQEKARERACESVE